MSYKAGDLVFFRLKGESWVLGHITNAGSTYEARAKDPKRNLDGQEQKGLKEADIKLAREDIVDEQPDDLLNLQDLHESTLLRCLYLRHQRDVVYTNIGAIVVAINPFNFNIPWYQDSKMQEYLKEPEYIEKNVPHSWAQAHNTYMDLILVRDPKKPNQCILISGESGAGKTEATKIVMKYLAAISCSKGTEAERKIGSEVGVKLNKCSPFLEAFGNAKTVRNDNSSRFGKFMKVKFVKGQLAGAETTKYLLEKSRVITSGVNERCYHSYYILVRGDMASKFKLLPESNYPNITFGKVEQDKVSSGDRWVEPSEFSTAKDFKEVVDAMKSVGITETDSNSVWSCVAGVLSLMSVRFDKITEDNSDGSAMTSASQPFFKTAAECLKVDEAELKYWLSHIEIGREKTKKPVTDTAANDLRDATCKALYNGAFEWLVVQSNKLCDTKGNSESNWIGLLDIFGFESFEKNSFEQLCINLANETLQQHYNTFIFQNDMEECRQEGINVTSIVAPDNSKTLELIRGNKNGILKFLDDACRANWNNDQFCAAVCSEHTKKNPRFEPVMTAKNAFIVEHYAGKVKYTTDGWIEKNGDKLPKQIRDVLRASQDPVIKDLVEPHVDDVPGQPPKTVGNFFKKQIDLLMELINDSNPHWIRCIKPHMKKQARLFGAEHSMSQLESSGVLGTVIIRKAGFPVRTVFSDFVKRYRILGGAKIQGKSDRDAAIAILEICDMKEHTKGQAGKTKIFMKSDAAQVLERKREACLMNHVVVTQRMARGLIHRLQACKERSKYFQRTLVELLTTEFKAYLIRTATIREMRRRMREEAEARLKAASEKLMIQFRTEGEAFFMSFADEADFAHKKMLNGLKEMKGRAIRFKAQQDELRRAETATRLRLEGEAVRFCDDLRQTYHDEVAMSYELELMYIGEEESLGRTDVADDERSARNAFWRSFLSIQSAQALDSLTHLAIKSKRFVVAAEALSREELTARMMVHKSYVVVSSTFRKQERESFQWASKEINTRLAREKRINKQLYAADQLWKEEVQRSSLLAAQQTSEKLRSLGVPAAQTSWFEISPIQRPHGESLRQTFSQPSLSKPLPSTVSSTLAAQQTSEMLRPLGVPAAQTSSFEVSPIQRPSVESLRRIFSSPSAPLPSTAPSTSFYLSSTEFRPTSHQLHASPQSSIASVQTQVHSTAPISNPSLATKPPVVVAPFLAHLQQPFQPVSAPTSAEMTTPPRMDSQASPGGTASSGIRRKVF